MGMFHNINVVIPATTERFQRSCLLQSQGTSMCLQSSYAGTFCYLNGRTMTTTMWSTYTSEWERSNEMLLLGFSSRWLSYHFRFCWSQFTDVVYLFVPNSSNTWNCKAHDVVSVSSLKSGLYESWEPFVFCVQKSETNTT